MVRWNGGTSWTQVPGSPTFVGALHSHNDGTGSVLYAAESQTIHAWDGAVWGTIGNPSKAVASMETAVTGELVVAGAFGGVNGEGFGGIAGWDGSDWFGYADGLGPNRDVLALGRFDDGSGESLYAAGKFVFAGPVQTNRIARWTTTGWEALQGTGGTGVGAAVFALESFDDGTGPALYVGGKFGIAGGKPKVEYLARWDGSDWYGTGVSGRVDALQRFDDGAGEALYAGGEVGVLRIDASGTSSLPLYGQPFIPPQVKALQGWDKGNGLPRLYAAGLFTTASGAPLVNVAKWNGTQWKPLGGGSPATAEARDLEVFDDGAGEQLYVCGDFVSAGGVATQYIARWDGQAWASVGGPGFDTPVHALGVHDDGTGAGPALYATGDFTSVNGVPAARLARWDGSSWSAVGAGLDDGGRALFSYDDGAGGGPTLWIGGRFSQAGGTTSVNLARITDSCPAVGTHYCTAGTSAGGCRALISATGTPSATATTGFDLTATGVEGLKQGLFFFGANGRQASPWGNGTSYQCVVPPVKRAGLLPGTGTRGSCDGSFSQDLNALWCPTCPKPNHRYAHLRRDSVVRETRVPESSPARSHSP